MKIEFKDIGTPPVNLIEECSEVIHIVCKGLRFGWRNFHPKDSSKSNVDLVLEEISDLEERLREFKGWIQIHKERE